MGAHTSIQLECYYFCPLVNNFVTTPIIIKSDPTMMLNTAMGFIGGIHDGGQGCPPIHTRGHAMPG
jgi:hypothetical protein